MTFRSSPEHYMEPLPLRRAKPFRPLFFSRSQRRRRRHRPAGFSLFKNSNFYYMTTTGKLIKQVDALRAKHPPGPIDKSRDYTAEINALIAWLKAGRPAQREPEQTQELEEGQEEELEEEFGSTVSPPMHIPEIERPSVDMLELLIPESPLLEDSQYVSEYEGSLVSHQVLTPRSPKYNTLRTSSGRTHHAREDQREWVVDDSAIQMNMPSFERDVESADVESNDDEVSEDLFLFVAGLVFLLVLYEYFFFLLSVLERLARG
ncbi:uncharacterized protein FTOL_13113 [Fusarium torulosum]|uniref:Uncharacterized protein n=1 Tax=Fusarium torulosum TaxID=33205 RepID=A0AAE8SPV9_9HYPO|nr:uncharacterized protein FTOL_13113 [Fusarium torulosum]